MNHDSQVIPLIDAMIAFEKYGIWASKAGVLTHPNKGRSDKQKPEPYSTLLTLRTRRHTLGKMKRVQQQAISRSKTDSPTSE